MQRNKLKRIFCVERISVLLKSAASRHVSFVSFCGGFILCSDQFFSDRITHYAANRPLNSEKRDWGLSVLTSAYLRGQDNLNQKKPYTARNRHTASYSGVAITSLLILISEECTNHRVLSFLWLICKWVPSFNPKVCLSLFLVSITYKWKMATASHV